MSITFVCDGCFAEKKVKEEFAGRKVKCKSCGTVSRIPMPGEAESFESDEDAEFGEPAPRRTGEKQRRSARPRAEGNRKRSRSAAKKRRSRGGGNPLMEFLVQRKLAIAISAGVILLLGIVGLVVPVVGIVIGQAGIGIGLIASFGCGLWLLSMAFKEELVCGLAYLFVPFYPLYFVITRWPETRPPLIVILSGWFVAGFFFTYFLIATSLHIA